MAALRVLLVKHRALAALLAALALGMKLVMPGGFMPAAEARAFTVLVCADTQHRPATIRIVLPGDPGHHSERQAADPKGTCPFSGLAMAGLPGADPVQLALAFAFLLALGFAAAPGPQPAQPGRLRPPLRAPPKLPLRT